METSENFDFAKERAESELVGHSYGSLTIEQLRQLEVIFPNRLAIEDGIPQLVMQLDLITKGCASNSSSQIGVTLLEREIECAFGGNELRNQCSEPNSDFLFLHANDSSLEIAQNLEDQLSSQIFRMNGR